MIDKIEFSTIILLISGIVLYWYKIDLTYPLFKNIKWYKILYFEFIELLAIFCILTVITLGYKVYAKDKFKQNNYKENIEINVTDNVE